MFKQKSILLFMVLALLVGVLSSCGKKGDKPNGEQAATTTGTESPPPEQPKDLYDSKGYLKDLLPETYNFDETFSIYSWDEQKNWEWVDDDAEIKGSVMQKLVERERNVEDRFGVDIKWVPVHGNWGNRTTFIQTLATNVQSNMHTYDLVGQYTPAAGIGGIQGLYADLNTVPWLDLEKPWWPSNISQTATIGDKLYFVTGDITPTLIRNVQCMFVNTDEFIALNLSNLTGENRSIYDVVRDQDWTLEMMKTLGIGTVGNKEGKKYGISFLNNVAADAFFYGAGFSLVNNVDGILLLSDDLSTVTLNNFFDDVKKLFTGEYDDVGIQGNAVFVENKALFYAGNIADSQEFTEKGVRFSILPQPKRDAAQADYYTCANFWVSMYSVPVDAKNPEMSGMILEGLGSESYRTLSDEIYYNIFQIRYSLNDGTNSAQMFDIVSDSVVFDTARLFADELGLFAVFRNGVNDTTDPNGTWASIYGGNNEAWSTKIANIYGKVG